MEVAQLFVIFGRACVPASTSLLLKYWPCVGNLPCQHRQSLKLHLHCAVYSEFPVGFYSIVRFMFCNFCLGVAWSLKTFTALCNPFNSQDGIILPYRAAFVSFLFPYHRAFMDQAQSHRRAKAADSS